MLTDLLRSDAAAQQIGQQDRTSARQTP